MIALEKSLSSFGGEILADAKVVGRLKDARGGRLSDPRFGHRMRGEGPYAEHIQNLFQVTSRKLGLSRRSEPLSVEAFRRPRPGGIELDPQLDLLPDLPPSRSRS